MTARHDPGPPKRPETAADHSLERRFTIGELAEASGTPVRRIRYYQSQDLLDPPRLVGRTGFYGDDHLQRLWAIASLRHRGIETGAIREILERAPLDPTAALREWMDAADQDDAGDELVRVELTRQELDAKLVDLPADALDRLLSTDFVDQVEGSDPPRYLVVAVACDLVLDLERATGIPLQLSADGGAIIARHAEELAEELSDFALGHLDDLRLPALDLGRTQREVVNAVTRVSTVWLRHHLQEEVRRRFDEATAEPT